MCFYMEENQSILLIIEFQLDTMRGSIRVRRKEKMSGSLVSQNRKTEIMCESSPSPAYHQGLPPPPLKHLMNAFFPLCS